MSVSSIASYFPFRRIRICSHSVSSEGESALLEVEPDRRFRPVCYVCGECRPLHSWRCRAVRDLDFGAARVTLVVRYRYLRCEGCGGVRSEDLDLFEPYQRVTKRLARYIHDLCKLMTVREVADHLGLDWKTVKDVDKRFLEAEHGQTEYDGLRILAVDEISIKKRHRYLTVVLDYETGRVVWLGKDRTCATLTRFFEKMPAEQRQQLEAIAMDMWDPYIKAVRETVPHVRIVFDLFHVVSAFNKVIDHVRVVEMRRAAAEDKSVYKGSRYLLLKNPENVRPGREKEHLATLLALNETLSRVMILKEELKSIWYFRNREMAKARLHNWCRLADQIDHASVRAFARTLRRHRYGILNHCDYPIGTSKLEGVNNKIKVIKRKAYGFHDERYFSLKVIQAFHTN